MADFEPLYPLAPHLEKRRIDLGTGLPSLPAACEDIGKLSQQLDAAHCLGVIALAALSDPLMLQGQSEPAGGSCRAGECLLRRQDGTQTSAGQ